jgi:hypothetical protein
MVAPHGDEACKYRKLLHALDNIFLTSEERMVGISRFMHYSLYGYLGSAKHAGRKEENWETGGFYTVEQRCTSRAQRTVCEDVCSSACTRASDATARPGM